MKNIFFLLSFLLIGLSMNAQSSNGITVPGNPFYQLSLQQTPTFSFSEAFSKKAPHSFSVYNKITGLNDSYVSIGSSYNYTRSASIFNNSYRGAKIDSFNPYGATNLESAVLLGIINSIF